MAVDSKELIVGLSKRRDKLRAFIDKYLSLLQCKKVSVNLFKASLLGGEHLGSFMVALTLTINYGLDPNFHVLDFFFKR